MTIHRGLRDVSMSGQVVDDGREDVRFPGYRQHDGCGRHEHSKRELNLRPWRERNQECERGNSRKRTEKQKLHDSSCKEHGASLQPISIL